MSIGGSAINMNQAMGIQQSLNTDLAARRQLLTNPAISGYTDRKLSSALAQANSIFNSLQGGGLGGGLDVLSTLGGVGLESMNLYGLGALGLGRYDSFNNDVLLNQVLSPTSQLGQGLEALSGPGTMAGNLMAKAKQTALQQSQQQLAQLNQTYAQTVQTLQLKQRFGIPIMQQELVQFQMLQQTYAQAVQQYQRTVLQFQAPQMQQQPAFGGSPFAGMTSQGALGGFGQQAGFASPFGGGGGGGGFGGGFGSPMGVGGFPGGFGAQANPGLGDLGTVWGGGGSGTGFGGVPITSGGGVFGSTPTYSFQPSYGQAILGPQFGMVQGQPQRAFF